MRHSRLLHFNNFPDYFSTPGDPGLRAGNPFYPVAAVASAKAILFFFFCFISFSSSSQVIYVVTGSNYDLYRLNMEDCSVNFVVRVQRQSYDISFDPDGNLYGISANGNLFLIDTFSGLTNVVHDFNGQNFNSLTIGADGIIYTIGDQGELWSYDPSMDTALSLGDANFNATGDLTFYKGDLYYAAVGDRIIKINLANPGQSTVIIDENVNGNILGIVSDRSSCTEINCYAITGGFSDVYLIDFENKDLQLVCELNISVGGGASTSEFLNSAPIRIDTLKIKNANCKNEDGQIAVQASGGSGSLQYSINGSSYVSQAFFPDLMAGNYEIIIRDELGCMDTSEIQLIAALAPVVDTIIARPSVCGNSNGSLEIQASGGSGPLLFSLDSLSFHPVGFFDSLPSSKYKIFIIDSAGCYVIDQAVIDSLGGAAIITAEVVNTSCGESNGKITVQVDSISGTMYSLDGLLFQSGNEFVNLPARSFLITVQDERGCMDTLTVDIASSEIPQIEVVETIPEKCGKMDGTIIVRGYGGLAPYQYSIDGSTFQVTDSFQNLGTGSYTVFLLDEEACMNSVAVALGEKAGLNIIDVDALPTLCGENTGTITLEVSGGTLPFDFTIDNHPFQSEPHFETLGAGHYFIEVTDAAGCRADTIVTIIREGCPIYIPNIFSPNGDGINDVFKLETAEAQYVKINKFYIFDRWGNNVYTAFNLEIHAAEGWWDGTFKRFTLNPGVFAYYIEAEFENGDKETFKGDLTLVR